MGEGDVAGFFSSCLFDTDGACGFVEMPNREEAAEAIAALNGKDLKGRALSLFWPAGWGCQPFLITIRTLDPDESAAWVAAFEIGLH